MAEKNENITNDLKDILGEELFTQVQEKIGDKKLMINDGNYIPKKKFNEIIEQKNEYQKNLEDLNAQLEKIKSEASNSDSLRATLDQLKKQNEELTSKHEMAEINSQIKLKALELKARDLDDILRFIDYNSLKDAEDKNKVINEQFKALKENKNYLFDEEVNNTALNVDQQRNIQNLSEREKYNTMKEELRRNPNNTVLMQQLFLQKQKLTD